MKYGLVGEKLGHSYSANIHHMLGNNEYELHSLPKEEFFALLKNKDFQGINVTIPYKEVCIPFLDELSPEAKEIGAVNVIINHNGKLIGGNTDAYGLEQLILKNHIGIEGKHVAILGSGGTSKTAYYVIKKLGAKQIDKISRNEKPGYFSYSKMPKEVEVIVNTTPSGMFPNVDHSPLELSSFSKLEAVIDVIYNPLRSKLTLEASSRGIKNCNGLYMLAAQAVEAHHLFFGNYGKLSLDEIYQKLLLEKENIVLIGMPTSGKSSVGKALSSSLHLPFYDVDEEVSKMIGKAVPDYIREFGIDAFRKKEKEVVSQLSLKNGIIIATGGGSILDPNNRIHLKNNGKLYYLDRDLSLLKADTSRPLSSSRGDLEKIYRIRKAIYEEASDIKIPGNGSVKQTAKLIEEEREKWIF